MSQDNVCPINISKQKMELAFKIFVREVASGLQDKFGEKAKGNFLLSFLLRS